MPERCITFTPLFAVYVDLETGAVTGRWDWSDSCTGENSDIPGLDRGDSTALADVVCAMLDRDARFQDYSKPRVAIGQLPTSYVVTLDGKGWGAHVFDTPEACEAKVAELREQYPLRAFRTEEVRIPDDDA